MKIMWTIFFLFLSDFAYDGLVRDHSLVRLFYLPFLSPRSVSRSEKPKFVCRGELFLVVDICRAVSAFVVVFFSKVQYCVDN